VQNDPEAHPASYTIGTESFPGIKRLEPVFNHPFLSSAEVEEKVELCLCSLSGPFWYVLG